MAASATEGKARCGRGRDKALAVTAAAVVLSGISRRPADCGHGAGCRGVLAMATLSDPSSVTLIISQVTSHESSLLCSSPPSSLSPSSPLPSSVSSFPPSCSVFFHLQMWHSVITFSFFMIVISFLVLSSLRLLHLNFLSFLRLLHFSRSLVSPPFTLLNFLFLLHFSLVSPLSPPFSFPRSPFLRCFAIRSFTSYALRLFPRFVVLFWSSPGHFTPWERKTGEPVSGRKKNR